MRMLTSQEIFAKPDKYALQENAWKQVDTISCQLEQMAQAKDALAQELSTAQQQVAVAQQAAVAAFQQEQDLEAQLMQHNAQHLSIAHLTDAVKSKDWNIHALSGQCCAANAGMLNNHHLRIADTTWLLYSTISSLVYRHTSWFFPLVGFNYVSLQSVLHVLLAVELSLLPGSR